MRTVPRFIFDDPHCSLCGLIFLFTIFAGKIRSPHLAAVIAHMVATGQAVYDPPNQTSAVLLYWRSPEEWAQVLHDWVRGLTPHPMLLMHSNDNDPVSRRARQAI